jgi:hypothetical protein
VKTFVAIENRSYFFSSCEGCPARCCDGREGSVFSQLLLEDFEIVSKKFPILFTFGEMRYLKANVLLSDGKNFCPYIVNHQCTIYDERPNVCRNYPLSGNLDNQIYIDDSCPAIHSEFGKDIVIDGIVQKAFDNETLHNYQEKFLDTHHYLKQFNHKEDFDKVITINDIEFYKYTKASSDDYMNLHIKSLDKLNKVIKEKI